MAKRNTIMPALDEAFVALNGLARSLERESDRHPEHAPRVRIERMRLVSAAMEALIALQQEGRRHASAT